jgi:hypothetical protein
VTDRNRLFSDRVLDELADQLGIDTSWQAEDFSGDDEGIEVADDSETSDPGGFSGELGETIIGAPDYPWPVTIASVTSVTQANGTVNVDVVIDFPEVPNATSYEVRVTPV